MKIGNIHINVTPYHLLALIAVLAVCFDHTFITSSFILFFAGPCNDSCASDAPGGGSSGGTDGAMDSGPGCGYCDGGSNGGATSTPYLFIKNKEGKFIMQNDVMIGTPSTYVSCKHVGVERHETGMLGKDIYPVSLENIDMNKGLELKIREIEPEESFIYGLKAHFYNVNADSEVVQDWTHQYVKVFKKEEIKSLENPVFLNQEADIQPQFSVISHTTHSQEKKNAVRLEKGDQLTFSLTKKESDNKETNLIVSSFWRNWRAGMQVDEIHEIGQRFSASPLFGKLNFKSRQIITRTASVCALISGMLFGGTHMENDYNPQDSHGLLAFIKKVNFAQLAYADTPHGQPYTGDAASLRISYKHPILGTYVHFATVQPRAYMPTDVAVTIPKMAFGEVTQKAEVMVEATKAHYVKNISLAYCSNTELTPEQTITFEKIKLNGGSVDQSFSQEPIHMVAGDNLVLKTKKINQTHTHFALEIYGFYTPLSVESKEKIGDWQTKLDSRERELIQSMYS